MTVSDLVDLPHLGLTVRAGAAGLSRSVSWAHVSELPQPAPWLEGGELLLTTGIGVPVEPAAQVAYVTALAKRRVAAIGIGRDGRAPRLSLEMLAAAERQSLPVLEIPFELPFSAITRLVAAANEQATHRRILAFLRIFETLRLSTSDGLTAGALFERLQKVSGCDLFLEAPGGAPLLKGVPVPPAGTPPYVRGQMPTIPGGYITPVTVAGRVGGYLVALEREKEQWGGLIGVQHIATIAAVEISTLYKERLVERRRRTKLFEALLEGVLDEAYAMGQLDAEGLPDAFVLVAARPAQGADDLEVTEVAHRLADRSIDHLLVSTADALLLLIAATVPHDALPDIFPELMIGISRPFATMSGLPGARREALLCVERAIGSKVVLVDSDAQPVEDDVLMSVDPTLLRALVDRLLGPVIAYDREKHTRLLHSLQAYFIHEGRLNEAAKSLHVHKNTLNYRLRTIERLTGRKLGHLSEMVELWTAVRAHDFLNEQAEQVPVTKLATRRGERTARRTGQA